MPLKFGWWPRLVPTSSGLPRKWTCTLGSVHLLKFFVLSRRRRDRRS